MISIEVVMKKCAIKKSYIYGMWVIYGLSEATILNGYFCFLVFLLVEILGGCADTEQYNDNIHLLNLNNN